jgi:anhydro-N-acetylmuramic acid kinase
LITRWIIGLASGSSAQGVDAVLLEVEGIGLTLRPRLLHALHQPHGSDVRELILRAAGQMPCEARQFALLHRLLGETFAAAARQVADRASFSLPRVSCVGCPGQSVCHDAEGRFPTTLGLGMAEVVAERTGITTISDFRARDIVAGGQGVPLGALPDYLLFRDPAEDRVLIHLGGSARIIALPADCRIPEIAGFEAGPGNALLDALMRQLTAGREGFDAGGKHAVQGRCIDELLQRWLAHPYLQRRPPKSLPRHIFGEPFAAQAVQQARQVPCSLHDLLCTATHFVAHGIVGAVHRFVPAGRRPRRFLLSGGGIRNGLVWHLLEQHLGDGPMERTDQQGVPGDVRQAVGFGILAALTLDGVPANVPSATGATGSRLLGSLTPGSPANWARCLSWMAAQVTPPLLEAA